MNKSRKEVELLVYKILDALDPSENNSTWYKEKFSNMNDKEFIEYFKQDFSIKFQTKAFEIEPHISNMQKAAKILNIPITEKVYLPFLYTDKNGDPVATKYPALVVYIPLKKMKQFISKKNSMSTNITKRDMKTGLLLDMDKNGNTSDREMECLAVMGMTETIKEFSTFRADAMEAKTEFYNTINNQGMVSLKDVQISKDDSLARNMLSTYLLGAMLNSNLVNEEDYLPITLKGSKRKINREA
jgi:hypothetical protein